MLKNSLGLYTFGNIEVAKERAESLEKPSRKTSLESLCIQYQYFGYDGISEEDFESFSHNIHNTLDQLYTEAEDLSDTERHTLLILLHRIDRRKHKPSVSTVDKQIKIELNPQVPKDLEERSAHIISSLQESTRFLPLVNWTLGILHDMPKDSKSPFDNNPAVIIEEAKKIIAAANNGESLDAITITAVFNAAGILLHRNSSLLSEQQIKFCRDWIWQCIDASFKREYYPQINDGLEECTHALPIVINFYPEDKTKVEQTILSLLLNITPLGAYKRICDYAVETINEANWFITEPELASNILNKFIHHVTGSDTKELSTHEITLEFIETILAIIPPATTDSWLIGLVKEILPIIANTLEDCRFTHNAYTRHHHLYRTLANYVLASSSDRIPLLLGPFLTHIKDNSQCEYLLEEFIYEEDRFPRIDAFWTVWKVLYPSVRDTSFRYHNQLIKTYLFSSAFSSTSKAWHSLRECDLWIFSDISNECGDSPSVLYSISRSLNYWASKYVPQGIEWLYTIINKYPKLDLRDDETNTIFYLERILNTYVLENKMSIRQTPDLKKKIMAILTFMVERNSTQAYMLREQIA